MLTGIGNLSVLVNGSTSWNISLYENNSDGSLGDLVASFQNDSNTDDGMKTLDVSSALYYRFSQNYTWFVNASSGGVWDNNTYYFTTFNGSGFIEISNISMPSVSYTHLRAHET